MQNNIIIGSLEDSTIEMAERKGRGHPDTICDAITEQISVALCNYYLQEFGAIMHHNVDKALLIGGQSKPAFKGGKVINPMSLIISGRATSQVGDKKIPIEEIAKSTAQKWLRENIPHLDVTKDIEITSHIRPGSADLVELFRRFGKGEIPLANDTSFGAGYYPRTIIENSILKIEELLNAPATKRKLPFIGEDIKVMGVNKYESKDYTIAIAMVDQYITGKQDYINKIRQTKSLISDNLQLPEKTIHINTADDYEKESLYLTVTGTSAENGDDGQVGRGNRINGLITPYHPMSLEATAGKNPVSHVGKIYNYLAMELSREIVENRLADYASVFILSQIGKPISDPQLIHLKLKNSHAFQYQLEDLVKAKLNELPSFWKNLLNQ